MENDTRRGFWRATGEYLGFVEPRQEIQQGQSLQKRDVNGPANGVIPPARPTYADITVDTALTIPPVYRAISIVTASLGQMDLQVFRNGVEISKPAIVREPEPGDSCFCFIEETTFSLAAYGNAYWRLYRTDSTGPVVAMAVLDPSAVTITEDQRGKHYWYGQDEIPARDIKHLKLMRRPGQLYGYGPIQSASSELLGALRLRNFANNWFDTSGVPTGTLTTDLTLGPEEAAEFAEAWNEFIRQHGGTAVLSQGLHYETLHLKPAEAQFLEVQQATVITIARLFGIPALHMLAEMTGVSNTYLNLEQANLVFLQTTLVRYMREIEEAFTELVPRGQYVRFNQEDLLRMDNESKVDVQVKQIQAGIKTVEEVRAEEGLPPIVAKNKEKPAETVGDGGDG